MAVKETDRKVVESLFRAMQAGPGGEEPMMSLFWADAVFVEPFSGQPLTHVGHAAIRESFRQQTANPLPDMQLTLDRIDLDGSMVRAEWTCTSSAFPAPMRGHDLFTIRDGKIERLEIVVTAMPGAPG
jgi:hypothetical protein